MGGRRGKKQDRGGKGLKGTLLWPKANLLIIEIQFLNVRCVFLIKFQTLVCFEFSEYVQFPSCRRISNDPIKKKGKKEKKPQGQRKKSLNRAVSKDT